MPFKISLTPRRFFLKGLNALRGNSSLRKQLNSGMEENDIRNNWKPQLRNSKKSERAT